MMEYLLECGAISVETKFLPKIVAVADKNLNGGGKDFSKSKLGESVTNTEIQIHKYKNTEIQIQIQKYRYRNTEIQKYIQKYRNTEIKIQKYRNT